MQKIILKKLRKSDLSFFKAYLDQHQTLAKQKGFNLDSKILEKFFPAIRELLEPLPKRATHVDLVFFGPGLAGAHNLARKIKIDAKNIRLNGEYVHDPEDDADRYKSLAENDFAIIEFAGVALPTSVKVVLISASNSFDQAIYYKLNSLLAQSSDSTIPLEFDALKFAVDGINLHSDHPVRDWLDAELLEEVALGDSKAVVKLNVRRSGRGITAAEFQAIKDSAVRTGRIGEELLNQFLKINGAPFIVSFEWVSQINAISPYDFSICMSDGSHRNLDAKSTSGRFMTPLYLSMAEIRYAVESVLPYDIYRLYDVTETSAKMRIAKDIASTLKPIYNYISEIGDGIGVDSLSFVPAIFEFEEREFILNNFLQEE